MGDILKCACGKVVLVSLSSIVDECGGSGMTVHYLDECALWPRATRKSNAQVRVLLARRSPVALESLRDKFHNYDPKGV